MAGDARRDLLAEIQVWSGYVTPVAEFVMPFLVELARTSGVHGRVDLLRALGDLCDPRRAHGPGQPRAHAVIAAHSERLLPLLSDQDPKIRSYAAYAVARSGPHTGGAIAARWKVETDSEVRAALLSGLVLIDPACAERMAASGEAAGVRLAGSLAAACAGLGLPPSDIAHVSEAFVASDGDWRAWPGYLPTLTEVLDELDLGTARTLADTIRPAAGAALRRSLAAALADRFSRSRSAPSSLIDVVRDLLGDADPAVRKSAVDAAKSAGEAALHAAGELAAVAADTRDRHTAEAALELLVRLDHPLYREPLLTAWSVGHYPGVWGEPFLPRFDPSVLAGARERLGGPAPGPSSSLFVGCLIGTRDRDHSTPQLLKLLAFWGADAAAAVPEILLTLPRLPFDAVNALAAIGPAAAEAVPALTEIADGGEVKAGHALLRITGDPGPLVAAAAQVLPTKPRFVNFDLHLAAEAGPAARPLVPLVLPWLSEDSDVLPRDQVAVARLLWNATGDPDLVLPTLRRTVSIDFVRKDEVGLLLAELPPVPDLLPSLWQTIRSGGDGLIGAARAAWRWGESPDELAATLVPLFAAQIYGDPGILDLIAEMGAASAVPGLTELADRDERQVTWTGRGLSWEDDSLRHRIRETVTTLISGTR
ncbi:hypothetical protein [Paractinoplanes atraurantiacus]|uniref:hypothetical protein n=1 Tax=Paractinoplanes atraurantiacus TaxID=1036182 RepID=UPI001177A762|nr:hypothetical protein [Actinoplanes atraurantiacus]